MFSISRTAIAQAVEKLKGLTVAVVGDFFLDRYFDIDSRLTEKSIETGLDAYQVVGTREYPGAAGTVVNNLAALGVGCIVPVTFVGDDPEGFALVRALDRLKPVCIDHVLQSQDRVTPTYMKPLVINVSPPRELNRLDKKNRSPVPAALVRQLAASLDDVYESCDVLVAVDQVIEPECGVFGVAMRERLCELAVRKPRCPLLVESRARLSHFHHMILHGNLDECHQASAELLGHAPTDAVALARTLASATRSSVICTLGPRGAVVASNDEVHDLAAVPVSGPVDTVGAGDAVLAGTAAALGVGWPLHDAVQLGQLVASVTIRKLGETGTATPDELLAALSALESAQGK